MNNIIVLWATPRSTSTAFEWMMRMRGDMACFHEPYGEAWYQGDDALAPRLNSDSPRKPGLSFASTTQRLLDTASRKPVFIKDMPQFTDHLWDETFLGHFQHSFLIRDPAKVLSSLQRSWDKAGDDRGFERKEIGFDEQRRLFELLAEKNGSAPPLIDSDDLLENPHDMVAAYCKAMDIAFIPEALSWEPGSRSEVLWYDGDDSIWHESLRDSDGLKPQPRKAADVSQLPDRLQCLYDDFMVHYEHMYPHRIRVNRP